jgi:hypothetical protein
MPLSSFDLAIFTAIIVGLPIAVVMMNRWRRRTGWWLLAGVVSLIVLGNVVERAVTGTSAPF